MLELFQTVRPKLFAIAYRMLGSVGEAEDLLQEAWLRFQAVDPAAVRSAEALLTTIVTRLALDQLKSARVQREEYPGLWLPEPVVTPDQQLVGDPLDAVIKLESVSLAFLHLLESLSPEERVVFLLREVFDYDYAAIASFLEKSEGACRQLFHRAKTHVAAHRPRFPTSADEHQRVVASFLTAVETGDMDGLMALMAEETTIYSDGGGKAQTILRPVHGRVAAARLMQGLGRIFQMEYYAEIVPINGRPGIVVRRVDGTPESTVTLDMADGKIQTIQIMRNPEKLGRV